MGYQSVFKANLFREKLAVITGGGSGSGIGRCIAHELASLGAMVIIIGRSKEKLETVIQEIRNDGGMAEYRAFDIRDEERVKAAMNSVISEIGDIDYLVNNAGGQFQSRLEDISQRGFEAVVNTNLVGGFLISREIFKQSMKKSSGVIVNISADRLNGMPTMAHYGSLWRSVSGYGKPH